MTFTEIVADVASRLNLTTDTALARIGKRVNRRYHRVRTSLGLIDTSRLSVEIEVETETTTQFAEGLQKIISLTVTSETPERLLDDEITYEEMIQRVPNTDRITAWAVERASSDLVQFKIDYEPVVGEVITLRAEGYEVAADLEDDVEPEFPESFHDILVFGALADELRKMQKTVDARDAEADYERMLSELRMFLAVSSYKDVQQAKNGRRNFRPSNRFSNNS